MKKLNLFFLAGILFMCFFSISATAQQKNIFIGKWNVLVEDTPNGDTNIIIVFFEKEGTIEGTLYDTATQKVSKFNKIENKEKSITAFFTAQGAPGYFSFEKDKENQDKIIGTMTDIFNARGTRIKE